MMVIFSDTHRFPFGRSGLTRVIRQSLARFAELLIRVRAAQIRRHGLPNELRDGLVSPIVAKHLEIRSYRDWHSEFVEKTDWKVIHQYSDELDALAKEFGEGSGLVHHGMSVFCLLETRWTDYLFTGLMAYIEMIRVTLEKRRGGRVATLTRSSTIENVALKFARDQGFQVVEMSPFERACALILGWIQKSDHNAKRKQAYVELLESWKASVSTQDAPKEMSRKHVRNRILFVAYKERTLRRVEQLAPVLIQKYGFEIVVLGDRKGVTSSVDATMSRLSTAGVRVFWATDLITSDELNTLVQNTKSAAARVLSDFKTKCPHLEYQGVSLDADAWPMVEDLVLNGSPLAKTYAVVGERALDLIRPDLIVHFEEWDLNRATAIAGRARGIRSISYQTSSPAAYIGLVRRLTSAFAAPGEFLARAFEVHWDRSNIEVIGDPQVDLIAEISKDQERADLCKKFGLREDQPIVMLLTTYADELISNSDIATVNAKAVAAVQNANAQLIVKVHPQMSIADARAAFSSSLPPSTVFIREYDLLRLSKAVDLALIIHSSALGTIMMVGTPVVAIQPTVAQEPLEKLYQFSVGKVPVVSLDGDLNSVVTEVLQNQTVRDAQVTASYNSVVAHVGPIDGKTSERFGEFLKRQISLN